MFKENKFTMWDDETKAINMADHVNPPEDMEGDWDDWSEEDEEGVEIIYKP